MPKIIVANVDNETMLGDPTALTPTFRSASALCARRLAWFGEPGDIVVLPVALSTEMATYIAERKGYTLSDVRYISPEWRGREFGPLGADELLDTEFIRQLSELTDDGRIWTIAPYLFDRTITRLAEALGWNQSAEPHTFLGEGGGELLNDKRVFRSLAAGRGVALAPGWICTTNAQLETAFESLIGRTGSLIIKQDRHSGADGNVVVSNRRESSCQGAAKIFCLDEEGDLREVAAKVWGELAYQPGAALLVEAYFSVQAVLYAEFNVNPTKNRVSLLNWGEQRMEPVFKGFFIPPQIPSYQGAKFVAGATELARLCCDLGFDGLMDADGIVTEAGEIIFNEVNARTGGCSHVHHIAETFLGNDYGDHVVIAAHNRVKSGSITDVLKILTEHDLHLKPGTRRGILLTAEDAAGLGVIEFMAVAPTRDKAEELERRFEDLLLHSLIPAHGRRNSVHLLHA